MMNFSVTERSVKDEKFEKLLKDLDFINLPLVPRRIRSKKSQQSLSEIDFNKPSSMSSVEPKSSQDDEKRRRKNRD
jgi:hypothetical protein